jgi:cytidyltransferase-like protein
MGDGDQGERTAASAPQGELSQGELSQGELSQGELVVATGVFDLLHIGHLRFLQAAHQLGNSLMVGVESDERVRQWKGPERPIQSQEDRCDLLSGLRIVDRVFLITGERVDPGYYVELLKPLGARYLAVTADDPYLREKREAMASIGVEVRVVVPRIENYSTSRLVRLLGLP